MLLSEEQFVLDNVMFWESYRWERLDLGHVYMHKFPSDKLYVGQTIHIDGRFKQYKRLVGNNPHHTNALKRYGWNAVEVAWVACPKYLLNVIETYIIEVLDLTDNTKGYNKTTGGRKGYRVSEETRRKLSESRTGENNHMFGRRGEFHPNYGMKASEETRQKLSIANSGENNNMYGKRGELSPHYGKKRPLEVVEGMSERMMGENNPMFGKGLFGEKNGMYGRTGELNPFYGKTHSQETIAILSEKCANFGEKNGMFDKKHTPESRKLMSENNSSNKPICVFGKLYYGAANASDTLREVCDTKAKGNFMKLWVHQPKHQYNIFYVTKEFYDLMKDAEERITRDMYEEWLSSTV
jgi:group I intron endonuclease